MDRNDGLSCVLRKKETVALLAEGVDRNCIKDTAVALSTTSPSSRRAWIEIQVWIADVQSAFVALLAEGVDRNLPLAIAWT